MVHLLSMILAGVPWLTSSEHGLAYRAARQTTSNAGKLTAVMHLIELSKTRNPLGRHPLGRCHGAGRGEHPEVLDGRASDDLMPGRLLGPVGRAVRAVDTDNTTHAGPAQRNQQDLISAVE